MTNYYNPSYTNVEFTNSFVPWITNTYRYVPYSNTLSVTVAGPVGMPSPVLWSVTSPSEWTNSSVYRASSYSDTYALVPVPTGRYTVVFSNVTGYTKPADITTNITGASPLVHSITGTYSLVLPDSYTLTMSLLPIAAVDAGAKWQVDGNGFWHNSGTSTNLTTNVAHNLKYKTVTDYYSPASESITLTSNTNGIRSYNPYTNSLAVVIAGITDGAGATWSITPFADFTNSSAYSATYTGSRTLSPIPTGSYAIAFNDVSGYTRPANITTNITGILTPTVTGAYVRLYGTLQINVLPTGASNATWTLITHPVDYTNLVTGTGTYTTASAPVGNYTVQFNALSGWTTPANASGAVSDGATLPLAGNYSFLSYNLIVNIAPPDSSQASLPGIGAGYVIVETTLGTYSQSLASVTYPVAQGAEVHLTAYPAKPGGASMDSFVYKWYRDIGSGTVTIDEMYLYGTNYNFSMSSANTVWLLFSKERNSYDNVGDIDQDYLPDEWEIAWFGDEDFGGPAEDDTFSSGYGQFSNPDGDFIPSASTNPPWSVLVVTNVISYSGQGGAADPAGYPLLRNRLLTRGEVYAPSPSLGFGYASGVAFDNYLECRGLDTYYRTNAPSGSGYAYTSTFGDDPRTDPDLGVGTPPPGRDTDGDTMSDGWEYYFWYWRSAGAYALGITNSANLSWVLISPIVKPLSVIDTDLDGRNDTIEFQDGTDPTHADTDGDSMDDYWEITFCGGISNALDSASGSLNPDGDYMAWVTNTVLTNGMVGTLLGTNVYWYGGTATNPNAAWNDVLTTNGLFDLYRDTILKASATLPDHAAGNRYAFTNYYGINASAGAYRNGYPVWVDVDSNGVYSAGDYALVNPTIKHDGVYRMAPEILGPGICMFDPRTAWTNIDVIIDGIPRFAPNTIPYTTYQEYLGGDYIGRLSWDAGGRMAYINDDPLALNRNSYSDPNNQDTDGDYIPDGWELYTGLNDNSIADAATDSDSDGLVNFREWANATHPLGSCAANWPRKVWPTDPGVIRAPSPNDPHPMDTDWDGVLDGNGTRSIAGQMSEIGEQDLLSNPTDADTDQDGLPDWWEVYAGTSITNGDANVDSDFDGLKNWQEYWTGTAPEWMLCDPSWGMNFICRRFMDWNPPWVAARTNDGYLEFPIFKRERRWFIPPNFKTCPAFIYANRALASTITNRDDQLAWLRSTNGFPAANNQRYSFGNTTLAGPDFHTGQQEGHFTAYDSDGDGMDDFWEVYHCLNPIRGMQDLNFKWWRWIDSAPSLRVGPTDADPNTPGNQVGPANNPFQNVMDLIYYYAEWYAHPPPYSADGMVYGLAGPHNFGLSEMDPDNDGLVNLAEYQYNYSVRGLHTCPSPLWRTSPRQSGPYSFVGGNYRADNSSHWGWSTIFTNISPGVLCLCRPSLPFRYAIMTEGFDTDNDLISDYEEVTGYRTNGVVAATDPLLDESPLRNRVMWLDGTNSWLRSYGCWPAYGDLSRFSVEAWVRPSRLTSSVDQVVCEKSAWHVVQHPDGSFINIPLANFQLGVSSNGLPYVLFHNVGGLNTNRALAASQSRLQANQWAHLAGVFDGSRLTIYVNGEASTTHPTIDVPARGIEFYEAPPDYVFWGGAGNCYMSIGARDVGSSLFDPGVGANFFAGCIDEVRVWDRVLSVSEIRARKDRRLTTNEVGLVVAGNDYNRMGANNLFAYYRFTDIPDPLVEGRAPSGLPLNRSDRPKPSVNYSLVYTNCLVMARDIVKRIPAMPPMDTRIVDGTPIATIAAEIDAFGISTTNYLGIATNLPSDFRNSANPYTFAHTWFNWDMGGGMWLLGLAQGLKTDSWLPTLTDDPDSTDSDGDGLPDWWEELYGLDPNNATGDNGAWGDPDHDGLNNRAEYLADTNPLNSDTDGDGIGDYDGPRGVYSRTYGEIFTDGDGMPDDWESQNGLDPQKYDANLDLDGDGWSNYAEYQAGTSPNNKFSVPQPLVFGVANYYGNQSSLLRFYAYETNTMDGVPQITKIGTDTRIAEVVGQADGLQLFDGFLPAAPIDVATVVSITALLADNTLVTFTCTGPGQFTYSGPGTDASVNLDYVTGQFVLTWSAIAIPPLGANVNVDYDYVNRNSAAFSLTGFKEGDFYLLSLMDLNNNEAFDAGEPMGIMDNQPAYLSYASISGMRVMLTDTRPGFGRFAWTASTTLTSAYPVVINKISESGAPNILRRSMVYPRNYFHEWDFHLAGIEGLMAGTYQWWMGSQNGTFNVNWPVSLATPTLVYPRGDVLYNALNQFAWTMDLNCPRAHFQVERLAADGSLALVTDKYVRAPWMDEQKVFRGWLDDYASDWGNGVYYWRVAGWTPQGESAWSEKQTFHVDLSSTNSRWVSGDIYYYGKAPATKIIVDAYDNRGFGGRPVARMTLTPPASTGWAKCSYTLRGLGKASYYVRAFLDVTPAGGSGPNSNPDAWESVGFYRDPNNFYSPGLVNLSDAQFVEGAKIVIRDRDTDNDKLPDAWEMAYFGNLDQTGDMDYDGDGETNLDEYIKDGVNQNPASWDTDGDGLSDGFEPHYNAAAFGFARSAKAVRATLNPDAWDTDGDGYSDGAELLRYRTDPLDPASYPSYQPLCTDAWGSPGDYDGDGRSDVGIYDFNAGVWSVITMAGQSGALPFGVKGAQPMVGDYTGDGCSEFAFYDKGFWSLYTLSGQSATLKFGDTSMLPAPADYTGDGRVDLAVFDTDNGTWYIYDIWSGALITVPFGAAGMQPVPGDYNGDGAADLAVYEPATGNWLIGCYHKYYKTWITFGGTLGGPTWIPVPGDYDGDGRNDVCLFESNTGRWMLYTLAGQFLEGTFGWKGCVPVSGDYDGDGRTDVAIYDANTGMWYIICWSGAYYEGRFGWTGTLPILKGR